VRIAFDPIEEGFLKATKHKKKIIEEVKKLERRKDIHSGTDILGALKYAATLDSGYATTIYCFSDMKQFPTLKVGDGNDLKFSSNTNAYFFLNTVGEEEWKQIINIWSPIITGAGLDFITKGTETTFIKLDNAKSRLAKILGSH